MAKQNGNLIYDFNKRVVVTEDDAHEGPITSTMTGERGQWPSCLGPKTIPLSPPCGERKCSCGKHTVFWLKTPEKIWPDNLQELMRVIEN